jgi:hypothetical protein
MKIQKGEGNQKPEEGRTMQWSTVKDQTMVSLTGFLWFNIES